MGRGRKTRRELSRGGTGLALRLNETLGGWSGVRITPMFGRWGYFVGDDLFACFPVSERDHDLWLRLTRNDQTRVLADPRVRPHRRFARRGWVEMDLESSDELSLALRWLRRSYLAALRAQGRTPPNPGPAAEE
jgi:hypothetical protein